MNEIKATKDEKIETKIILISGFKRAGKDYVASILNQELKNSAICSFAEPLKKIIADTLNISLEVLDKCKNNEAMLYEGNNSFEISIREVLQGFGSEAMKPWFGDSVWVDVLVKKDIQADYIIIPDWRFNVEYETLIATYEDVITLRIDDFNIESTDLHASETEIMGFPFEHRIDNTTKDYKVVPQILKFIKGIQKGAK